MLRAAAEALPEEVLRSITLISDGLDTCARSRHVRAAGPVRGREGTRCLGVDLSVHTAGYQVDDQARQQLSCIAEATGGTDTDTGAGTLEQKLPTVVESARRSYEASCEGRPHSVAVAVALILLRRKRKAAAPTPQ